MQQPTLVRCLSDSEVSSRPSASHADSVWRGGPLAEQVARRRQDLPGVSARDTEGRDSFGT